MKIVVLTSDGIRHKFFANSLDSKADSSLIISQSKQNDALKDNEPNSINEHFKLRDETEKFFFPNNYSFNSETLSIRYTDLNTNHILQKIKEFQPDMIFVFGSSIIKEPLLSNVKISSLAVGDDHFVAIDRDGKVLFYSITYF